MCRAVAIAMKLSYADFNLILASMMWVATLVSLDSCLGIWLHTCELGSVYVVYLIQTYQQCDNNYFKGRSKI